MHIFRLYQENVRVHLRKAMHRTQKPERKEEGERRRRERTHTWPKRLDHVILFVAASLPPVEGAPR
jgi:hypothetical protein